MNDEKHLRELLSGAVPDAPPNPGRASGARAYAATQRRRRATAATALGMAAVVVAIAVPFALSRDDGGGRPAPPDPSQSPAAVPGDFSCPQSGPRVLLDPDPGPAKIEPGVVAIRLCHAGGPPWQPPIDALVENADALVTAINRLQEQPPPEACTLEGGLTWGMSFQYGDGQTRFIEGQNYSCGGVLLGSATLGDARDASRVLHLFHKELLSQRATAQPPDLGEVDLRCDQADPDSGPGLTNMPRQLPLTMTSAVLCWRFETESEQPTQQAQLSDADLATLLDDLNHNRTGREITEQECVGPDVVHYEILGVNAWGDWLSLDGYCGAFDLSGGNSDIWRPNAESQGILDRLVRANPLIILDPDDRTPPDQVLSIWADLVNAGKRDRADGLWVEAPRIPAGVRVDLKADEQRTITPEPGTPLSAYAQVIEVTALYRLVPPDGSWVDYHEMRFTLGRQGHGSVWQIVSMADHGVRITGR